MMNCVCRWRDIKAWFRNYENLLWLAVKLIYAQIACALIGSLGVLYSGVLVVNLGILLFALVAIESSSQNLARTYAALLFCSVFLDLSWLLLFSYDIWHIPSEFYGAFASYSVKLTLAMQIIGFSVKLSSSLVWIQMYRLGVSEGRNRDEYVRCSFLEPPSPIVRHPSGCDDGVEGSTRDPVYYSSLFEDARDDTYPYEVSENRDITNSVSAGEPSQLNLSMDRSFHVKDIDIRKNEWTALGGDGPSFRK
ncbi:hypothetical protein CDL12_24567 [Handroanthus impetiginosus]|uniref:Uncharacterized protein n=1 Tax=Handroanthus impetiginosus TaxID=429701 RepID=A0A2G9GC92_9LAMI|nr:hypothetical protein CDL12_24567 [Handroanthus impetiginosus]